MGGELSIGDLDVRVELVVEEFVQLAAGEGFAVAGPKRREVVFKVVGEPKKSRTRLT